MNIMTKRMAYFIVKASELLFNNLEQNIKCKYYSEEDNAWVIKFLGKLAEEYAPEIKEIQNLPINLFCSDGKMSDSQKAAEDCANAIKLHRDLKITRVQGINLEMWTCICHLHPNAYKYLNKRWIKQDYRGNITIQTRFTCKVNSSLLNDNGISRLWFQADLVYDKNNKDNPYYLVPSLMKYQQLSTDLLDTGMKDTPKRIRAYLKALQKFENYLKNTYGKVKGFNFLGLVRELNKILNHDAAIRSYDYLCETEENELEFIDFIYNTVIQLLNQQLTKNSKDNIVIYEGDLF